MRKLERLFSAADTSGDGLVSAAEFQQVLVSSQGQAMFAALELQTAEASQMFELMDDGHGVVSYLEFCQGVLQLKGQARKMDIITIMRDCRRIIDRCDALEKLCSEKKSDRQRGPLSSVEIRLVRAEGCGSRGPTRI